MKSQCIQLNGDKLYLHPTFDMSETSAVVSGFPIWMDADRVYEIWENLQEMENISVLYMRLDGTLESARVVPIHSITVHNFLPQ